MGTIQWNNVVNTIVREPLNHSIKDDRIPYPVMALQETGNA